MFKKMRYKVIFRVTLAYFVCVFLPILIFLIIGFINMGRMTSEENLERINDSLISFEQALWKEVYDYDSTINSIATSEEVRNYVSSPKNSEFMANVASFLEDYTSEHYLEINGINFYTYKKQPYSLNVFGHVSTVQNESWYKNFFADSVDQKWYPIYSGQKHLLVKVMKIFDNNGNQTGILRVDLNLKHLIYSTAHSIQNGNTFFAVDSDGVDIYFDDTSKLYEDRIESSKLFSDSYSKLHQGNKEIINHKKTTAVVKIFSEFDIIIGCGMDNNTVVKSYNAIIFSLLFTVLILIIFAIIFYYYLFKIFATLKRDLNMVGDYVENNPSGRLAIKYDDEIGDIERQYNNLLDKIEKLTKNIILKERLRKNSEIAMLQSQLNPHFIYNVINHFRMRAEINEDYDMADSIAKFGKLMRYNMMNRDFVTTLKEEIMNLRYYLDLELMRFSNQLEFNIDCETGIDKAKVPKCILQPIVENSLKYGKMPNGILKVNVSIKRIDDDIHISIRDNGKGADAKTVQSLNAQFQSGYYMVGIPTESSTRIGLKNINQRIGLIYDDSYHLTVNSEESEYFEVLIKIPLEW